MARDSVYLYHIYTCIYTHFIYIYMYITHICTNPYIRNSMYTIYTILWMYILYSVIIVYIILYIIYFVLMWTNTSSTNGKMIHRMYRFLLQFPGKQLFLFVLSSYRLNCLRFSFFCRSFCYLMRYHNSTLNCHQMIKQSCTWKILLLFGIR